MKSLTRLAFSNNRKNKKKSILVIMTVLLTSMLLMAVATFGYGAIRTDKENAENLYGSYYGSYQSVTKKQLEALKERDEISALGIAGAVGRVRPEEKTLNLFWADEMTRRLTNIDLRMLEGFFPEKKDEIAATAGFFESLGYEDARVGDQIALEYQRGLQRPYETGTFVISGILKERIPGESQQGYTAYVSREFFASGVAEEHLRYIAYIRLKSYAKMTYDTSGNMLKKLASICGINSKQISENRPYLKAILNPGREIVSACAAAILLVTLFSVIIIYYLFQDDIGKRRTEYGRIKAMGATGRQMRRLVFREGMFLSGIGLSMGLTMGFFMGKGILFWKLEQMRQKYAQISIREVSVFSPFLLAVMVFLCFGSVWLALKRPMKIAASIAPVEIRDYEEQEEMEHV